MTFYKNSSTKAVILSVTDTGEVYHVLNPEQTVEISHVISISAKVEQGSISSRITEYCTTIQEVVFCDKAEIDSRYY